MSQTAWQGVEWPLAEFFERIYLLENTELAAGSPRSVDDHRIQIGNFQKWWEANLAADGPPPPPPRRGAPPPTAGRRGRPSGAT